MIPASDLDPGELRALLHFYADAGVTWLVDDTPIDRIAEFEAQRASREEARTSKQAGQAPADTQAVDRKAAPAPRATSASQPLNAPIVAVPDEQAVAAARFAAESARSLSELKTAIEAFGGCNLKTSARSTVTMSGDPVSKIMIVGPMPNADDDREGQPFAGRQGQLLDRMLAAIGLARDRLIVTNIIPWRPPGNRMPSPAEINICQPFIERQIALIEPDHLLLLGNFPARFFFGNSGTIHSLRGEWRTVSIAGHTMRALATLHPHELLTAPGNKALAWRDLLLFSEAISGR